MIHAGEVQPVDYSIELVLADTQKKDIAQGQFTAFVNAVMVEEARLDQNEWLQEYEATRSRSEGENSSRLI